MKASIAASLLSLISLAAAGPVASSRAANVLLPEVISQYHVWTGAIDFNTPTGKVFKDGKTSDITTLVTFRIPSSLAGRTCTFHFFEPTNGKLSGTGKFDVFTSLAPATTSTSTWPPGNLRDQYRGRFQAKLGAEATPGADGITTTTSFPCPAGQLLAGELVGTGDVDDIEWAPNQCGGAAQCGPFLTF